MKTLDLDTVTLARGVHSKFEEGVCVMEAVAYVAGEPHSDHPQCVSPVIAAFCRRWNDDLSDADRQTLKPYIPRLVGTNTGPEDDTRRAWMATDWLVRVYLPAWLRLAKLDEQADAVSSLAELLNPESWEAAKEKVAAARAAAWGDAASAAARAASWGYAASAAASAAAGGDAASDAASDAAWDAAWDAAGRDAAGRDAASAVASAASWDAASAAASAAAWDAAGRHPTRAAARAAASAAASAAAWDALKPTVVVLQQSAIELLDRMIAVGKTN